MKTLITASALLAAAGAALGSTPTITLLPLGYTATDISDDGLAVAGNVTIDGSFETFRWTAEFGIELLGRASAPVIGFSAGSPNISSDGTRISASILSSDNALTQGYWIDELSWTETMPPMPADGIFMDNSYGSAWGLSGDGSTLTGFYWTTGADAKPCKWSKSTGMIALPHNSGRSARVNGANFDGSVVVGWEEGPTGQWQPRAWRGLVKHDLAPGDSRAEANAVSGDGTYVVGNSTLASQFASVATIWTWDGSAYQMNQIGVLPGTPMFGTSMLNDVSNDGSIAIGFNAPTNQFASRDGVVWTPGGGLVRDVDFLASIGLTMPANLNLIAFSAMSSDGTKILASCVRTDNGLSQNFIIDLAPPVDCAGDTNGDNAVNGADLSVLLSQFGQSVVPGTSADFNADGNVDGADLSVLLSSFGNSCA